MNQDLECYKAAEVISLSLDANQINLMDGLLGMAMLLGSSCANENFKTDVMEELVVLIRKTYKRMKEHDRNVMEC